MSQSYLIGEQPPMWWLEAAEADIASVDVTRGEDVLRFGDQFVALEDIASYRVMEVVERCKDRLAAVLGLIGLTGLVSLVAMLHGGWLEQMLTVLVFLFIVGMSSVGEVLGLTSKRYFQVTVFTHGGRKARYNSSDNSDVGRLVGFLEDTLER